MEKGIKYTTTGERSRSRLNSYHGKPTILDHSYGAVASDVKTIKSKVTETGQGSIKNYRSNYTIGFEIEKSRFGDGQRKEYALIQGYESDGSCGVEAVTNILPLLPPSQWRNKIFDMVYKAKGIMDDDLSPSSFDCGGHISIQVNSVNAEELYKRIRLNSSILMSLFRKRLKNNYVKHNLRMEAYCNDTERLNHFNGWHRKYQFCLLKDSFIEFRIPSRITSYKQMFRRYELMYTIVDFTITKPNGRFSSLLNKVKPILLSMYEGDSAKVDMIIALSKDFRKFIKSGTITNNIRPFIR